MFPFGATLDGIVIPMTVLVALMTLLGCLYLRPYNSHSLEITQLYVYPVKALRGFALAEARIGRYGLIGDRNFSLQRVHRDGGNKFTKYETMLAGTYLQLVLFHATIEYQGKPENSPEGQVVVRWHGRGTEFNTAECIDTDDEIRFPLCPSLKGRQQIDANLHGSKASAYDMGDKYSTWFTDRLGFEVRLFFIGNGSRQILGSLAPNSKAGLSKGRLSRRLRSMIPGMGYPAERLTFTDLAHYLVVTEESSQQVTSQLDDGYEMDVTKFRPNIVVKGASSPFVEDFWGELTFEGGIQMPLTANCWRCQSITVDYKTGKRATGESGMVWKKLNRYRRVDPGVKYSPVFGRYGYCFGPSQDKKFYVGQKATVSLVNKERTSFDWPH